MKRACLLLFFGAAAGCAATPPIAIDRIETTLRIREDGAVDVVERLTWHGAAPAFTFVRPPERFDAAAEATVTADGAPVAGASIDTTRGVRISAPAASGTGATELRYRIDGAVAVSGVHATLFWRPLPDNGTVSGAVQLRIDLPAGTQITGDPYVEGGQWSIAREPQAVRAELTNAAAGNSPFIVVPFAVDPRAFVEPQWQIDMERGHDLVPAFISAGLFIVVVAIGVVIMVRVQYPVAGRTRPADPVRVAVARGLRVSGALTLILGVLAVPVVEWQLGHFGRAPHAISLSLIVSGALLAAFGARKQI